jgi:anaerobic magnesium-protoporphyrin IX monomethyl ester cyclase
MRILLVNPPTTHIAHSGVSSFIDSFVKDNPMPPLGLMYLAAYVERATEHEVKICDMNVGDSLFTLLEEWSPEVVGITTTTLTLYDALLVAKYCKEWNKNITTVIGGPHCGIYPNETASFPEIDYVVQGEGELPFLRVLNGYESKILEPEYVENLDLLPFPARHLIDLNKYHSTLSKKRVTSMVTSRHCPMKCIFCYQPKGAKWRARSAKNVVEEMGEIAKMGIGEIEIYDDTFTFDRDRVMDICEQLTHYKVNDCWSVDWNIRTRVDKVDFEMLKKMKLAGCKRINYGIESCVPETLKTLRKGFTVSDIDKALFYTKEVGIELQAYLMLGSPNETVEDMEITIGCVNRSDVDYAYYSLTSPMPGTQLYEQGLKEYRYENYWQQFALNPDPEFKMKVWDEEHRDRLVEIMESAYKSFYLRPSYIMKQIVGVKSINELVRKGRMALGMVK